MISVDRFSSSEYIELVETLGDLYFNSLQMHRLPRDEYAAVVVIRIDVLESDVRYSLTGC